MRNEPFVDLSDEKVEELWYQINRLYGVAGVISYRETAIEMGAPPMTKRRRLGIFIGIYGSIAKSMAHLCDLGDTGDVKLRYDLEGDKLVLDVIKRGTMTGELEKTLKEAQEEITPGA